MISSIIKKLFFLSFFLFLSITLPRQIFAATLSVGSCGGCYTTIHAAVEASSDGDTIYVPPGTYDETVIVNHQLIFDTVDAESVVNVAKFDLQSSVSQSRPDTFTGDYVVVRAGSSANLADGITFVKVGGVVDVENKNGSETCLNNHWEGGIIINKNLTFESNSLTTGEEACLTNSEGTAITVTSGNVTIKNIILFDSVNGLKVDGGKVTIEGGAITNNTHGIVTASGTEVSATRIYWGQTSGPYNAIHNSQGQANDIGNEVTFCPFYTDQGRTNLDDTLCRSSSSSNNSSSSSSTNTPTCSDQQPGNSPQLFQINRNKDKAILYFAPSNNPVSYYYIAYGFKEGDEQFGTWFSYGSSSGVVSYTINCLSPRVTYYFKIRAGNGCMPGSWSNWLQAKPAIINYLFK